MIPLRYRHTLDFSEGLAGIQDGDLWGYINRSGKLVIPARYQRVEPFSEGLALVMSGDEYRYIDKSGRTRLVLKTYASEYPGFRNGLAVVSGYSAADPNLYGYIDHSGRIAIKPQYNGAGPFSEGLAWVTKWEEDWFCIDTKGRPAIRPAWHGKRAKDAREFSEGLAAVAFVVPSSGGVTHH